MSRRFPPLVPQTHIGQTHAKARLLTLPDAPGLPWLELALGFAMLILMRGL